MQSISEQILGVVDPDRLYTLESLKQSLNISDSTLRAARRRGLTVHYAHGRAFVLGRNWIDYICGERSERKDASES